MPTGNLITQTNMTPLTPEERLYEAALKYIGAKPDGKDLESRKCRLFGDIGPEGQGFGPAFRTAAGLDADTSVPEFSKTLQGWALWGRIIETTQAKQGDTVVTDDFVGVVDCVRGDEVMAIGFQNGSVRMAKVNRLKSVVRRSKVDETRTEPVVENALAPVEAETEDETEGDSTEDAAKQPPESVTLNKDGTPRKRPGRKPKELFEA